MPRSVAGWYAILAHNSLSAEAVAAKARKMISGALVTVAQRNVGDGLG
jgi:hypothetical protein